MTDRAAPTLHSDRIPSADVREGVAALMAELAHELRNPVAALQGCAQTLSERGDALSPATRMGLTDVVVRHAQRVDWLLGAALALAGTPDGIELELDLAELAAEAGHLSGVPVNVEGPVTVVGVQARVGMACQALLMALATEGTEAVVRSGAVAVRAPVRDLKGAGRGWKIGLVETLVAQEGGELVLDQGTDPMSATLRFRTQGG